jgi:hypothetical protein
VSRRARGVILVGTISLLVAGADCGAPRRPEIRQGSKSYLFNITSDPIPPHAREDVRYTITVRDRESNQPIENGEGRIFANTLDGARTWDGFTKAPGVGTYTAKLNFVASGQWAIGIQFHSDSTKPLEKTEWMQDVLNEREGTP